MLGDPIAAAGAQFRGPNREEVRNRAYARLFGRAAPEEQLGRYVPIDELGTGAMGWVIRAYDPKLQREVALKRLAPGQLLPRGRERLIREARAMAQLNHPNVVSVYDVHSDGDDVIIAMELVHGQTLAAWLNGSRALSEIQAVFLAAGRGLAAAHGVGLLHRDFKPANVLVAVGTTPDERVVKVTDFGLAKRVTDAEPTVVAEDRDAVTMLGTDASKLTDQGVAVGTPRYMAPEQHLGDDGIQADQYAFCVAVWEAMAGRPPFRASSAAALLASKRRGPPEWPRGAPSVPSRVVAALRKGLSPEPEGRWSSMAALLAELGPERASLGGRLGRWGAAIFGSALVMVPVVGTDTDACPPDPLGGTWGANSRETLTRAMGRAPDEDFDRLIKSFDRYADRWAQSYDTACRAKAEPALECLELARAELAWTIRLLVEHPVERVRSAPVADLPNPQDCDYAKPDSTPPALRERSAAARMRLAELRTLTRRAQFERAEPLAEELVKEADVLGHAALSAETLVILGELLARKGEYEAAVPKLQRGIAFAIESGQHRAAVDGLAFVIDLLVALGRRDEARGLGVVALGVARQSDADGLLEARILHTLGKLSRAEGNYEEALRQHRRALTLWAATRSDGVLAADTRREVGNDLIGLARYAEAEVEFEKALATWEKKLKAGTPGLGIAVGNVGEARYHQGNLAGALEMIRRAERLKQDAHGPDHPQTLHTTITLAAVLTAMGQHEAAEAKLRPAVAALERSAPAGRLAGYLHGTLSQAVLGQGGLAEAEREARIAIEIFEAAGASKVELAETSGLLADVLAARGEHAKAEEIRRSIVADYEAELGRSHPLVAGAIQDLARSVADGGRPREALPLLERADAYLQAKADVPPSQRAEVTAELARVLLVLGEDRERVTALTERARKDADRAEEMGDQRGREALHRMQAWAEDNDVERPTTRHR